MIEVLGLSKRYGSFLAVDNISFTVNEGEIMGFLGPNGAGKSTTLNMITGYLSSTSGSIKIDGEDILENPIEAKKKIGFLPEIPPLYPEMTVRAYLNFVYDLKNCKIARKKHLDEICEVVKIKDVENRIIKNLSKGYRQRVGIAGALVNNPEVLIFDEPTVGLDPKQIVEIRNLLKRLGKSHTIILSTHILSEVQAVCDRIVVINKGKIVANTKTEDISSLVNTPSRLEVTLGAPKALALTALKGMENVIKAEIVSENSSGVTFVIESKPQTDIRHDLTRLCGEKDWTLMALRPSELTLEDIFMELVGRKEKK